MRQITNRECPCQLLLDQDVVVSHSTLVAALEQMARFLVERIMTARKETAMLFWTFLSVVFRRHLTLVGYRTEIAMSL